MKLQNLAIIFIIIILPISMILNSYIGNQVKTLNLQISYDNKLDNATYDALKAFQLNTINSDSSDLANSKLRDIEASANTFFNSIASNFNMAGYNKDILTEYVPALVYTMYDGYYIYSPYENTLDDTNKDFNEWIIDNDTGETKNLSDAKILSDEYNKDATYKQGDRISGLKPYIYYSCRYQRDNDDFVITYSLDNYITIQGKINGEWVFDSGYLLDDIVTEGNKVTYRGVTIEEEETTEEYVFDPDPDLDSDTDKGEVNKYKYIKLNGVKYYKDENTNTWFSILNGKKYTQDNFKTDVKAAIEYYKEAKVFTEKVTSKTGKYTDIDGSTEKTDGYKLGDLKGSNAVDENGEELTDKDENGEKLTYKLGDYEIFQSDNNVHIEDPNSNFNQQRLAVIRYSIERNLSIAIANYNSYTEVQTNFQMPALKEDEWDKIINNVSIISFLQGLNIGGKVYNGYSIITNNKNQEVVNEDSIYMIASDNQYHRANGRELLEKDVTIKEGALNIDFEKKSSIDSSGNKLEYFPKQDSYSNNSLTGSYESIVTQTNVNATDNLYEYMENQENKEIGSLASKYFTALGRERYGMYKTNNDPDEIKRKFIQ